MPGILGTSLPTFFRKGQQIRSAACLERNARRMFHVYKEDCVDTVRGQDKQCRSPQGPPHSCNGPAEAESSAEVRKGASGPLAESFCDLPRTTLKISMCLGFQDLLEIHS